MTERESVAAVLRRAVALVRQSWSGDLYALFGDAVDRLDSKAGAGAPQLSLAAIRELQRTVQPGEPFGDPAGWARRANADEVRRALESTLERLLSDR